MPDASRTVGIEESYAHCRRIARAEARNFYYGFRLLPPAKHAAFMASNSKGQHYHQNFRSNADHPWTKAA